MDIIKISPLQKVIQSEDARCSNLIFNLADIVHNPLSGNK